MLELLYAHEYTQGEREPWNEARVIYNVRIRIIVNIFLFSTCARTCTCRYSRTMRVDVRFLTWKSSVPSLVVRGPGNSKTLK